VLQIPVDIMPLLTESSIHDMDGIEAGSKGGGVSEAIIQLDATIVNHVSMHCTALHCTVALQTEECTVDYWVLC